jgi:hypothetical protein
MVDVVVSIYKWNIVLLGKTYILVLSDVIFLAGMYIGVVKINREVDVGSYQSFHYLACARSTT